MTGDPLLDWAILAVSLFNALLLAWLGLTVLLNSDRRRWGIWVAGGGMLLGAAFFISHSAILGLGLINFGWEALIFWWSIGLLSAISLPFLWYVIILWYAGYWEDRRSDLHRRHKPWFILTAILLFLGVAGIISAAMSLGIESPRFGRWFLYLRFSQGGIPILVLSFSFYMLMSILLSLDTLRRPGPSARVMGDQARRRAQPWLAAASVGLFFVAVIVTAALFWIGQLSRGLLFSEVYQIGGPLLARVDLLVSLLIAGVIILLGQAIVSYEVFTGKSLPRRGLRRQWQRALLLSSGTSILIAAAATLAIRPVYGLLLAALLTSLFYAMVGWRTYVERERMMDSIRPFVASQGLYNSLLTPAGADGTDLSQPFHALCRDVLDTQLAYLAAAGPLASLVEKPLLFPDGRAAALNSVQPLLGRFKMGQPELLAIDPAVYGGALWAVPLWSERGLNGVLLLGEKRGGGLYTREEIEIASITGERLIDALAGAEMSRRLMRLQRQRMAQTVLVDQQTRRVLHDEILPDLHAAMIGFSAAEENDAEQKKELLDLLTAAHRQISDLLHELPPATALDVERLGLLPALRRSAEIEYGTAFDRIDWQVDAKAAEKLGRLPSQAAGVIYYAAREGIRNAARHGRMPDSNEVFVLTIRIRSAEPFRRSENEGADGQDGYDVLQPYGGKGKEMTIVIEDNGRGVAAQDGDGSRVGQGLALHSTMMAIIGGTLSLDSTAGDGTRMILSFTGEIWDA